MTDIIARLQKALDEYPIINERPDALFRDSLAALQAALAQQRDQMWDRKPMTEDAIIWQLERARSRQYAAPRGSYEIAIRLVRAIEAAHGIGVKT